MLLSCFSFIFTVMSGTIGIFPDIAVGTGKGRKRTHGIVMQVITPLETVAVTSEAGGLLANHVGNQSTP